MAVPERPHVSAAEVDRVLREALAPLRSLEVIDDSHLHAGHAGAREGSHLRVRIVADGMAGLTRVARHRLVYDALRRVIPQGIHALAIEARSPEEADAAAPAPSTSPASASADSSSSASPSSSAPSAFPPGPPAPSA